MRAAEIRHLDGQLYMRIHLKADRDPYAQIYGRLRWQLIGGLYWPMHRQLKEAYQ